MAVSLFVKESTIFIMEPFSFLGKRVRITVDRPLGSRHPQHGFIYPLNYGFLPGTRSADGEELDAYVLGVAKPLEHFEGICIAVIHRLNDDDDKMVVVPPGQRFTRAEIRALTSFQERWFNSELHLFGED